MTCAEFQQGVEKYFRFLFKDKGFKVVRVLESTRDRCLLFLASEGFQIKIYKTIDEINVLIGDRFAGHTWEDTREGRLEWYFVRGITRLLANEPDTGGKQVEEGPRDRTHDAQFKVLADLIERYFSAIEEVFGSGGLERLRPMYEERFRSFDGGNRDSTKGSRPDPR